MKSNTLIKSMRISVLFIGGYVLSGFAASIGIDFIGNNGGTEGHWPKTKPMAPQESAGVVVQKYWNSIADCSAGGAVGTKSELMDDQGNKTTASISWEGNGGFCVEIPDSPGNYRMMRGYLDIFEQWKEIKVTGLPSSFSEGFKVYVYIAGHSEGVPTIGRYQIGEKYIDFNDNLFIRTSPEFTDFTGKWDSSTTGKGNYIVFDDLIGTSFTLKAKGLRTIGGADLRAPVNGMQIVSKTTTHTKQDAFIRSRSIPLEQNNLLAVFTLSGRKVVPLNVNFNATTAAKVFVFKAKEESKWRLMLTE